MLKHGLLHTYRSLFLIKFKKKFVVEHFWNPSYKNNEKEKLQTNKFLEAIKFNPFFCDLFILMLTFNKTKLFILVLEHGKAAAKKIQWIWF